MADGEDGEELSPETLQGLHAKAFISENGWNTTITIGSGNATRPALLSGANVELFATLTGKRSKVGTVDEIMGPDGFGRLTRAFDVGELPQADSEIREAEARINEARRSLCHGSLRLRCEQTTANEISETLWRVWLVPTGPLPLPGIGTFSLWLITRGEGHGQDALTALRSGRPVNLGSIPLIDLTRFLACRLKGHHRQRVCSLQPRSRHGRPAGRTACRHPAMVHQQSPVPSSAISRLLLSGDWRSIRCRAC